MSLDIFFNNPTNVYRPGESVSGKVTAVLTEPLAVKGVRLTIHGWAYVYWTQPSGDSVDTYRGTDEFFLNTITVWGNPLIVSPQAATPILPSGRHTFNFSFPLPDWLPGAFFTKNDGGDYGRIEYSIKAHIERPALKVDITAERLFIIYPVYNLNLNPEAALPQQTHGGRDVCRWFFPAGRIGVVISLPKSGYSGGEVIATEIDIINHSRNTVESVTMALMKHLRYKHNAGYSTHFERRPLQGCTRRVSVKPGKTRHLVIEEILVPSDTAIAYPTFEFPPCSVLNIYYTVAFQFLFDGCEPQLEVHTPVIIGTVPVIVATTP